MLRCCDFAGRRCACTGLLDFAHAIFVGPVSASATGQYHFTHAVFVGPVSAAPPGKGR